METSKENITDFSKELIPTTVHQQTNTKTSLYLKNRERLRYDNPSYVIWMEDERKYQSIEQVLVLALICGYKYVSRVMNVMIV